MSKFLIKREMEKLCRVLWAKCLNAIPPETCGITIALTLGLFSFFVNTAVHTQKRTQIGYA